MFSQQVVKLELKSDEDESVIESDIMLKPIGVIKATASDDEIKDHPGDFDATLEVFQEFSEGWKIQMIKFKAA